MWVTMCYQSLTEKLMNHYNAWVVTLCLSCFFFNDTATTEIYTLSLHDALPIWGGGAGGQFSQY